MPETELLQELAVLLFQREKLTLEGASKLAKLDQLRFQHLLASREIPIHYVPEFEEDLRNLKQLGRL